MQKQAYLECCGAYHLPAQSRLPSTLNIIQGGPGTGNSFVLLAVLLLNLVVKRKTLIVSSGDSALQHLADTFRRSLTQRRWSIEGVHYVDIEALTPALWETSRILFCKLQIAMSSSLRGCKFQHVIFDDASSLQEPWFLASVA